MLENLHLGSLTPSGRAIFKKHTPIGREATGFVNFRNNFFKNIIIKNVKIKKFESIDPYRMKNRWKKSTGIESLNY